VRQRIGGKEVSAVTNRSWDGWERERSFKRGRRDDEGRGSGKVTPLGNALEQWKEQEGVTARLGEAEVVNRFAELVGPAVAARAEPVSLRRGKLVLKVTESAWRHQLLYMRRQLIGRINGALGQTVVREIVLTG
jgi:predicted nucleic acid-binding Zn ribbon protein